MRPRPSEGGYALLDALIALAVFGVMSGMFIQAAGSTALASRHVAQSRQALLLAQSRLAATQEPGVPAESGREDGFQWHSEVSAYPGSANGRGLEKITVKIVDAASGRPVTVLSSLRLAR